MFTTTPRYTNAKKQEHREEGSEKIKLKRRSQYDALLTAFTVPSALQKMFGEQVMRSTIIPTSLMTEFPVLKNYKFLSTTNIIKVALHYNG